MRLIRNRDLLRKPWKNGGGTTAEIAAEPPGAGLDDVDWRLSMADVASDGPFSTFPGIDRTLVLIEGEELDLLIDGEPHRLAPASPIVRFPGEAMTTARLRAGPVRDFNVMTRRDRFRHEVSFGEPGPHTRIGALLALEGPTMVRGTNGVLALGRFDTLLAETEADTVVVTDRPVLLVRLEPASAPVAGPTAPVVNADYFNLSRSTSVIL